jgi:hypothetical protein
VDVEALISETAAMVATGYASLELSNAAGLLLDSRYEGEAWQLMPLALELTAVHEHVGRDGEQRDLGNPDFDPASEAGAKCEALNDALQAADDGWVRIEDYWLALARELHARLDVPVLVNEIELPIAEQLRRQQPAAPTADPVAGLGLTGSSLNAIGRFSIDLCFKRRPLTSTVVCGHVSMLWTNSPGRVGSWPSGCSWSGLRRSRHR